MVWKMIRTCFLVGLLLLAVPTSALAYEVYESGNISSTYTEIFKDVLSGTSINDDYVYFRSGQYTYTLLVGDLEFSNNIFTADTYTEYTISTNSSGYSSTAYHYSVADRSGLSFSPGNYLIYSNLGNYPTLIERGNTYDFTLLFAFLVFAFACLVRPIFKFIMRNSSSVK